MTNYEIGFKSNLFDRRLTFNGDYYFAVDHNFQFFYVQASTGSQIISNIDAVHLSGVEFEAQAHPFAGLNLSAGVGTTDSDVTRSSIYPEHDGLRRHPQQHLSRARRKQDAQDHTLQGRHRRPVRAPGRRRLERHDPHRLHPQGP